MNYLTLKLLLRNFLMVALRYFTVLVTSPRWQLTNLSQATNVMSSVTLLSSKVFTLIRYVSTTKIGVTFSEKKVKRNVLLLHSRQLVAVLIFDLYTNISGIIPTPFPNQHVFGFKPPSFDMCLTLPGISNDLPCVG